MANELLATKLHAPQPRALLVALPRLIERLSEALTHNCTLISAPPGFGKTTLLTEWIVQSQPRAAWLSLDEEDNDPARFLSYLYAAGTLERRRTSKGEYEYSQ